MSRRKAGAGTAPPVVTVRIARKRRDGRGSVTPVRGRPGVWRLRYTVGFKVGREGKRVQDQRCETVHGTREEAEVQLTQRLHTADRGQHAKAPTKQTVAEYVEHYLTDFVALKNDPTTLRIKRDLFRLYLRPVLGAERLASLTLERVQVAVRDLRSADPAVYKRLRPKARKPLSPVTVSLTMRLLSEVLDYAVHAKTVAHNPIANRKLLGIGELARKQPKFLPEGVRLQFLDAVKQDGHPLAPMIELGVRWGLGPGELCGLQWRDVSFKDGTLSVRRQRTRDGRLKPPKTKKGLRTISLDGAMLAVLKAHRGQRILPGDAFVFAHADGTPYSSVSVSECLYHLSKRLGFLPIRLYPLRHTSATWQLESGMSPRAVSDNLGHSSTAFTQDTYQHLTRQRLDKETRLREQAEAVERAEMAATGTEDAAPGELTLPSTVPLAFRKMSKLEVAAFFNLIPDDAN